MSTNPSKGEGYVYVHMWAFLGSTVLSFHKMLRVHNSRKIWNFRYIRGCVLGEKAAQMRGWGDLI